MNSNFTFYMLIAISVLGVTCFILCSLIIAFDKIKRSSSTKNLCIFLGLYMIFSIIWLKYFNYTPQYVPKGKIMRLLYGVPYFGLVLLPITLMIAIPGHVIRFEGDKRSFKLYLIGLLSLFGSIYIWGEIL